MATGQDVELFNPPEDGVSAVKFAPASNDLLASSWDKTLRLYDVNANVVRLKLEHAGPVLDCAFTADGKRSVSGGLAKSVLMHDFETGAEFALGAHDEAVSCVARGASEGHVFTAGWDSRLCRWDPRASDAGAGAVALPDKALTMDADGKHVIVGCAARHIVVYDQRDLSQPVESRVSPLKYPTRCIRCFPDEDGFAVSSVEGRVSVDFLHGKPGRFAFKCHRARTPEEDVVFPVNALAFHPNGTFATGGSDGFVGVWDRHRKKRIAQLRKCPTGIASLDYSHDGALLAIASSYTFDEGEKEHATDQIFIHTTAEN